ncbi:hypothetical protein [Vibrio alginolyticus]
MRKDDMEDHTESEKYFNDQAIEILVEIGCIERGSPTHGVLKQYLGRGYDSLSNNQRHHFHESVKPLLSQKCFVCGEPLSLDELVSELGETNRMCGYHRYQVTKDD